MGGAVILETTPCADAECGIALCGGFDVAVFAFDFGSDPATGYRDQGEAFTCRSCGASGDAADLVVELVKRGPGREREAAPAITRTKSA